MNTLCVVPYPVSFFFAARSYRERNIHETYESEMPSNRFNIGIEGPKDAAQYTPQ